MTADRISVSGLSVFGRHGALEHERRDGQQFVVDITLALDLTRAAATDDLTQTVDYGGLANRAAEIVGGSACNLIETVAGRIADEVLRDSRVESTEVTVHKPAAPIPLPVGDVAVTVARTRDTGR